MRNKIKKNYDNLIIGVLLVVVSMCFTVLILSPKELIPNKFVVVCDYGTRSYNLQIDTADENPSDYIGHVLSSLCQ